MTEAERPMDDGALRAYWDQRARRAAGRDSQTDLAGTVTDDPAVAGLRDRLEMAHFERLVRLTPQMRVLDLAGGAGRIALRIAPQVAHVTLLDISSEQLALAQRRARARAIDNLSVQEGSLVDAPYGGPYDLILLLGACVYLSDAELEAVAERCRDALAPGGRLILKEPVSTTGAVVAQTLQMDGLPYRACFRPREQLADIFGRVLRLRYQSATCAHPFPWFIGGTEGAIDVSRSVLENPLLAPVRSLYLRLDPTLREVECRLRRWPATRRLLAPVPVVQDFLVLDKPEACAVDLSIVVIAFNEEACLRQTVTELLDHLATADFRYQLVLVDDGSGDRTAAIMHELAGEHADITVVALTPNRGIGGALRAGFDAARGAHVTWLPADGQIPPEVVSQLYGRRHEAPMLTTVYRSRADPFYRSVISQTLNTMIRLRTGQVAKSGGNYLFERSLWLRHAPRDDDSMMLSTAFRDALRGAGVAIGEVEIDCRARLAGHSKVLNPKAIWRTVGGLLRISRRGQKA